MIRFGWAARASVFAIVFVCVVACDKDSDEKAPKGDAHKSAANGVDMADLISKRFSLNSDLNFAEGSTQRYRQFQGPNSEGETVRYSYFFRHNLRVSQDEAIRAEDFCEVFVEASPHILPSQITFPAKHKLIMETNLQSFVNGRSYFVLTFHTSQFNYLMVRCQNIANSMVLQQHLGHLFTIVPSHP